MHTAEECKRSKEIEVLDAPSDNRGVGLGGKQFLTEQKVVRQMVTDAGQHVEEQKEEGYGKYEAEGRRKDEAEGGGEDEAEGRALRQAGGDRMEGQESLGMEKRVEVEAAGADLGSQVENQ
eukprot:1009375-Amorphochlora_amoeboformis.AAC.1